MSTPTLTDEVMTEITEAIEHGVEPENLVEIEQAITSETPLSTERVRLRSGDVVNQGFTYMIPPTEAAQWIAAWRMEVGRDGVEYGRPTKLNIQQLGLHLSRRRPDGGRLFVINMPERVVPPGRFQCFAVPDQCQKRLSSKGMLLDHIENFHPTAARHLREELEIIRKSLNSENAVLQQTIQQLANMDDDPWVSTPEAARKESADAVAHIDVTAGEEKPDPLTLPRLHCELCSWPQGVVKWANTPPTQQALRMHIFAKHKEEA